MLKPTLVFVHGAFHDSSCWDAVRSQLGKQSYPTVAISLPSIGSDPPVDSHYEDTAAIRKELERLVLTEHKEVVLIMHSYAGVPGSESVKGLEKSNREGNGGVIHCVYLSGFLVPTGASISSVLGGLHPGLIVDPTDPRYFIPNDGAKENFYNDVPSDVAEPWVARLRRMAVAVFSSKVKSHCCEDESVPCSYMICEKDKAIPPDAARALISSVCKKGKMDREEMCDSGHSPWLSQVSQVVIFIRKAAGESEKSLEEMTSRRWR